MKPSFLGLATLLVAANAHALSDGITAVNVDESMSQLTITGKGLKGSSYSIVTLGGVKLSLISQNATTLVAQCPGSPPTCPTGDWLLQVSTFSAGVPVGQQLWNYTIGAVGAPGPQGPKGDMGAAGATGPAGPTGSKGDTGIAGVIGPAGPAGPKGDTGAAGSNGPAGPVGPKGDSGLANVPVCTGYGNFLQFDGAGFQCIDAKQKRVSSYVHPNADSAFGCAGAGWRDLTVVASKDWLNNITVTLSASNLRADYAWANAGFSNTNTIFPVGIGWGNGRDYIQLRVNSSGTLEGACKSGGSWNTLKTGIF